MSERAAARGPAPAAAPFDTSIGFDDGDDCQASSAAAVMGRYRDDAPNVEQLEAAYQRRVPGWRNDPPHWPTFRQVIESFGFRVVTTPTFAAARQLIDLGHPLIVWNHRWGAAEQRWFLHAELLVGLTENHAQFWDQQRRRWHSAARSDWLGGKGPVQWAGQLYRLIPPVTIPDSPLPMPAPKEPPMSRVTGVVTQDTRRDISDLINQAAEQHGFDAVGFLGGLIAESNLHEHATRERDWPDVSYGLSQPTVAFLHPDSGLPLQRGAGGAALDTPENRRLVREWAFRAENIIPYTGRRYAELIARFKPRNALETWTRWNAPARTLEENRRRQPHAIRNYENGLREAERYRAQEAAMNLDLTGIVDLRGKLPTLGWGQTYGRRSRREITGAVIHFTDGAYEATVESIARYQISQDAVRQTEADQPFPAIAYHVVVKQDGLPHLCHDLEIVTWHAGPANAKTVAICFTGNATPKPAQINGIARALVRLERSLGRPLTVSPHQQYAATNCPGAWAAYQPVLTAAIEHERRGQPPPVTRIQALDEIWRIADLVAPGYPAEANTLKRMTIAIKETIVDG